LYYFFREILFLNPHQPANALNFIPCGAHFNRPPRSQHPQLPFFKIIFNWLCDLHEGIGDVTPTTKTMKILVVHRQNDIVNVIKSVLSRRNPVVLQTESGLDGLLTSRIEHFDLIICGTDLPVVTGFELVRSIRTNSVNRRVPVVFLTPEVDEKTQKLSRALGAIAVLSNAELTTHLDAIVRELVPIESEKKWSDLAKAYGPAN
jgi:CheY-like chemotaxis protein